MSDTPDADSSRTSARKSPELTDAQRRSWEQISDFFDNASVPLHLVGPDGTILRANRAELDLLGYEEDEYVGRHIADFHVDGPVIGDILTRLQDGETLYDYEARLRHKDGSTRHVLINSNVRWEDGEFVHTRCFTRDITERRRAEEALRESEERFRVLADSAPVLIWVNGPEGAEYVNRTYREFLGVDPEDLTRFDWARFVHPDDREAYLDEYLRACERREDFEAELRFRRADGEYRWMRSVGRPRFDDEGRWLGYVGATADVTDAKRAERQVEEAARRKDEFLAVLSHELRGPLAPLRSGLELLQRAGDAPDEVRRVRGAMERQLKHLTRLVDDLLDVGRISRDELALRKETVRVADVIDQAVEACRPRLDAAGQTIEVSLPPTPLRLEADPDRLVQVLGNLLDNASKYSAPRARIRVRVESEPGTVVLRVADEGAGIAREDLGGLFEMFSRGSVEPNRVQEGLGIGLALVRRVVELHGGTVRASSEGPGHGSEFVVRLPATSEQAERSAPASVPRSAPGAAAGLRVLVADDNRDSAEMLAELLELAGADTHVVFDGAAAVEATERFRPDVALLDVGMPGLDGYEACRRIRAGERQRETTVIAVTGWGQDDDRRRADEAGFDHHLVKPVGLPELESLLERVPRRSGTR